MYGVRTLSLRPCQPYVLMYAIHLFAPPIQSQAMQTTVIVIDDPDTDIQDLVTRLRTLIRLESPLVGVEFEDLDLWPLIIERDIPLQRNGTDCAIFMCM
jgi:hypothetical protein